MDKQQREALLNRKLGTLLRRARAELGAADWKKSHFDQRKASPLALFAEIAYYKISEHEYKRIDRAKIIPCMAHQFAIASQAKIQFEIALQRADFEDFFIVESRNFVAVGIVVKELTIVAIRGTYYLYDWTINFRMRKRALLFNRETAKFHSGFLHEAELLFFTCVSDCFVKVTKTGASF